MQIETIPNNEPKIFKKNLNKALLLSERTSCSAETNQNNYQIVNLEYICWIASAMVDQ